MKFFKFLFLTSLLIFPIFQSFAQSAEDSIFIFSNSPLCEGENLEISARGADSYFWTGPNNFESRDSSISLANAAISMGGTYVLIANTGGKLDTLYTNITVKTKPIISFLGNVKLCETDSLMLTARGANSYVWQGITFPNHVVEDAILQFSGLMPGLYKWQLSATSISGCVSDSLIQVEVSKIPSLSISPVLDTVCAFQTYEVQISSDASELFYNNVRLRDNRLNLVFNNNGQNTVHAISGQCINRISTNTIVIQTPQLELSPDTTITTGKEVTLSAKSEGSITWNDDPSLSCLACIGPVAKPSEDTRYCANVNLHGCINQKCMNVFVEDQCIPVFPNLISLSAGINDALCLPELSCYTNASLLIYDRWGNQVYKGVNRGACWRPGRIFTPQVFTYLIKLKKAIDGESVLSGSVLVVE